MSLNKTPAVNAVNTVNAVDAVTAVNAINAVNAALPWMLEPLTFREIAFYN